MVDICWTFLTFFIHFFKLFFWFEDLLNIWFNSTRELFTNRFISLEKIIKLSILDGSCLDRWISNFYIWERRFLYTLFHIHWFSAFMDFLLVNIFFSIKESKYILSEWALFFRTKQRFEVINNIVFLISSELNITDNITFFSVYLWLFNDFLQLFDWFLNDWGLTFDRCLKWLTLLFILIDRAFIDIELLLYA